MKRLTVNKIEKFIQTLESTERFGWYSEEQKLHAIACLNNYCRVPTSVNEWTLAGSAAASALDASEAASSRSP